MIETKNFTIEPGFCTLASQGKHFDLHNCFELVNITHDPADKKAVLTFSKSKGDWVPENSPGNLQLAFSNVSQIFYKDHDTDYPPELIDQDQNTLSMMGFSNGDDETMDGITDIVPRPGLPALLFIMETGKAIKIVAGSVELLTSLKNSNSLWSN